MISVSAGAVLCLGMGVALAQPAARLSWPPEFTNAALPKATFYGGYLKKRMPEHFDYVALPAEGNFRDELAISLIHNAPRRAAAAAWIEFIRSDVAAAVYQSYGFDYVTAEERIQKEKQ
jgi:hypothetical protein